MLCYTSAAIKRPSRSPTRRPSFSPTSKKATGNFKSIESVTQKLLTVCQECGHKHRENVYCHCFTEADDEDDPDDGKIGLINFDLLVLPDKYSYNYSRTSRSLMIIISLFLLSHFRDRIRRWKWRRKRWWYHESKHFEKSWPWPSREKV